MSDLEPVSDEGRDTAALRRALGCFVTGVTVVTARDVDGAPHGFTANSFTSVSLDPPLVLVCVGQDVERFDVYQRCSRFAINVLGDSQRAISDRFATEHPNRFVGVRWREGTHGLPILDGCIASLQCESWRRLEAGDHMILIGRVLAWEESTARPLAYWQGSYRSLPPDRDSIAPEDEPLAAPVRHPPGPSRADKGRRPDGTSMTDDELEFMCTEIARLVMGWTALEIPWAYDGVTPVWHTAAGDPVMTVFSWRPDRDDAQNIQVLDRMVDLGFELTLTAGGERTVVEIGRGSRPVARDDHPSRRLALLRAALAAAQSGVA